MFKRLLQRVKSASNSVRRTSLVLTRGLSRSIPAWLRPGILWFMVLYPFRVVLNAWRDRLWRNLLWGLPTLLGFAVLGVLSVRGREVADNVSSWYWNDAQRAIAAHEDEKAEMLLKRVLQNGQGYVNDAKFSLACLYRDAGHNEKADLLFRTLAPDDRQGNPQAHRLRAIDLCAQLNETSAKTDFKNAWHHLDKANDEKTPEMLLAWGEFYAFRSRQKDKSDKVIKDEFGNDVFSEEDLSRACEYLEPAARTFPEVLGFLGDLYALRGDYEADGQKILKGEADRSYRDAGAFLRGKLEKSPNDGPTREEYARVLGKLGGFDEASEVLEKGLELEPNGNWKSLLSDLYVLYHDSLKRKGTPTLGELLAPLEKALQYNPNSLPALSALMSNVDSNPNGNSELHELLNRVLREAKQPALAHLALGNLYSQERDTKSAQFHFERAVSIMPELTYALNNLAWILSNPQQPPDEKLSADEQRHLDLVRALELIEEAIKAEPENLHFLDTRGGIHMKLQQWKEAYDDLEKVLIGIQDNPNSKELPSAKKIREDLAEISDQLGFPDLAAGYRGEEQTPEANPR